MAKLPLYLHVGHEHPFAIQNFHNRHQVDYLGDGKPVQLQMVIKRKTPSKLSLLTTFTMC